MKPSRILLYASLISLMVLSCKSKNSAPSKEVIGELGLKKGDVISCGPPDAQFGSVDFETTCDEKSKKDFTLAIELLHSFEYEESEKMFSKVIDETPECAMSLIHISEPTRRTPISYAVFCLKKKIKK